MIVRFTGLPIEIKSITPEDVEKLLSNKHFLDKLKEKLYLLGGYGSNSGGTIRTDYISLKDCTASGNTPFYAGANSTNVSGNTNWTFAESPRAGGFMHFFR